MGSQDQILTSIGGFNKIDFNKNKIRVNRFNLKNNNISQIEDSSIILFTGEVRTAEKIESDKFRKLTNKKIKLLDQIVEITDSANKILKSDNFKVKEIGELLDDSWKLKKSMHKEVSNHQIDEIYDYVIKLGAYGGKLLGAGAGGFLYVVCPKNKRKIIQSKLTKLNCINIGISKNGSRIISPLNLDD